MALKILFADDSMTAQNMGKKILSDAGYEVVAVSNGAAALKKINEVKPELVVLDVYMPGYTGLEVCEKMRAAHETSATPVLLTVGKMEAYKPEDGARVRANGVIVKPFEATDLLAAVEKLTGEIQAARASKTAAGAKTFPMPTAGSEAGQQWKGEAVEEIPGTKPESVSVPSEMASHAAYGLDDLLPTHTPAAEAASVPAALGAAIPVAGVAPQQEAALVPQPENSVDAEFVISPVQVPSASDFGVSSSFRSDVQESAPAREEAPVAGKAKESLLQRFDAILKDGFSASRTSGFQATSAEPTPDVPAATEAGLETTLQKPETGSIEIVPEPGLDPFSSEATATGQAEYQSWDVSESTPEPLLESTAEVEAAPATGESIETVSLHQYVSPDVQPHESAAEATVVSADTEIDDFEKRVAEAMAAYQATEPHGEHEVAPAITERELEEAELAQSKHAVAHETEHVGGARGTAYAAIPPVQNEIADPVVEAEPYVIDEPESSTLAKAAAAAASATGDSELARALAEAVAAQNRATTHLESEAPKPEAAKAESVAPKPIEATMITKIVTRVLEHSLPDILNKVMTELEKEEKDKKK